MCATAARARIANTTFDYDGSRGLSGLNIDLEYTNSSSTKERAVLWAVERSQMNISQISPLWGIVNNSYENSSLVQTIRRDYLWIPAAMSNLGLGWSDTTVSAWISGSTLRFMYTPSLNSRYFPSIGGWREITKWDEVKRRADDVAKMLDLIFVNQMAPFVVGSRSALHASGDSRRAVDQVLLPIQAYRYVVMYAPIYAIPVGTYFDDLLI